MALPPGITPKTVTVGIASFFDGSLAEGTATITAPVNVVHTPTNRPIFSSQMSHRFVDGETSFNLCPTDAPGLNRVDFAYKLTVVVQGALVQPEPVYFLLPTAGPSEIDLDSLVTVPSNSGTPISVTTVTSVNGQTGDVTVSGGGGATTDASLLTSGTLAPARIADNSLPVAKLTGTLSDAQIPAGIARDSEVSAAVAALVASAPATLDTLDELANALGDDANFAATTAAAIGAKADTTALARAAAPTDYTGTLRGAWAGSIAYAVGDVVTAEGGLFRCIAAHTSNGAGFRYDRHRWLTVDVPVLDGGTTVPVRRLQQSFPLTGAENPPRAGLFQRRPKQFDYSREKPLWVFDAAADFTNSGQAGPVTAGTQIGGSVVITSHASASGDGFYRPAQLPSPVDISKGHLRIPTKISNYTSNFFYIEVTSNGVDFTNKRRGQVIWGNSDEPRLNQWTMVSLASSELNVITGTGADLTAITGMRFVTEKNGTQFTVEVSRVAYHPNPTDNKAKVVLWLDDGSLPGQTTAIKTAADYGFPVTLAYVSDNFTNSAATLTADQARYVQDFLKGQIAVHAVGPVDHTNPTPETLQEQMLAAHHWGLAMGFHGVEDLAYFNTGFPGADTPARDQIMRRLFSSARSTKSRHPETLPPGDPSQTRAYNVGGGNTSVGQFQPYVTRAIACNGLAQFIWHGLDATALTEFATFMAWLDANRATVDVVTAKAALDPYRS